jgi:hypothetical protein
MILGFGFKILDFNGKFYNSNLLLQDIKSEIYNLNSKID